MRNNLAPERVETIMLDASLFGRKRTPTGPYDFGDDATVGLCVKKSDKLFHELTEGDFGWYLGLIDNKYVVALRPLSGSTVPTGAIEFDTLDELKCEWMLD